VLDVEKPPHNPCEVGTPLLFLRESPFITCLAFIFLSLSELLQVLTINQSSLWIPKVDIFVVGKHLVPSKKAIKWWLIPKNQIKKAGRKRRKEERVLFQPFIYLFILSI
jgi:hypothetical protein